MSRLRKNLAGLMVVAVILAVNLPAVAGFATRQWHDYSINRPDYKATHGHWTFLDVPERFKVNAIHAALLHTGKVLIVAGSGNNAANFDKGTFKTVLWDPSKPGRPEEFKLVDTPVDFFCAGHVALPDGRLLIAGGTKRFEVLKSKVKRAAGALVIKNENPDARPRDFHPGTLLTAPGGQVYRTLDHVTVPPARKIESGVPGKVRIRPSETKVFAEAVTEGAAGVLTARPGSVKYGIQGLKGRQKRDLYAMGGGMTLEKQDFQGIKDAYEFDPVTERYHKVQDMAEGRWYPTMTELPDGRVMTVSGLDTVGQITRDNEIYDPRTKTWRPGPKRFFPTYPALFLLEDDMLFFSGMSAGYGPGQLALRPPGIWDYRRDTDRLVRTPGGVGGLAPDETEAFTPVPGLPQPELNETGASVLLPPAQDQRVMVMGGGPVGERQPGLPNSTARTAIVDLNEASPRYVRGPDLSHPVRYPSAVLLPDDTVLSFNGSGDYRGRGASDVLRAEVYHPATNRFHEAASPAVGRNYHAEGLLLPDGRVLSMGSDPLFADEVGSLPGTFDQRIEIYTPTYLHNGEKAPVFTGGRESVGPGRRAGFQTPDAARIREVRLMRPSAVTHVTDVEQRSIRLNFIRVKSGIIVTIPSNPALVPPGWYMLFGVTERGTPSPARWVRVQGEPRSRRQADPWTRTPAESPAEAPVRTPAETRADTSTTPATPTGTRADAARRPVTSPPQERSRGPHAGGTR
ncbi:galactose oxidase-like domain-containing protein [Streptosporangium sp. NPDC050855]|uniref:galactose oxidase-like domain-containing protein n=1 Tax=Streptosporangium sp. NPDC050855 TaxID=3366194 RepID=UPI003789657B